MPAQNPIELITIQKNYPISTSETDIPENYQTFCQVYAELQIGSGREFFGAQKINSELSGLVRTLQYIKGITSDMQVVCSRGIFEIKAVIDLREQNKIELHLKRVD